MVPRARLAHLDDEDLELTQRHRQDRQFSQLAGLSGGVLELIAVDVVHQGQVVPAADRTALVGRLAVEPSCVFQVRRGIADIERPDAPAVHVTQHCPLLKRVVDDLPLRAHGEETTRSARARRQPSLSVARRLPSHQRLAQFDESIYGNDVSVRYIVLRCRAGRRHRFTVGMDSRIVSRFRAQSGPCRSGRCPVLELAILGLLQEAPMHGYELRKELATKLGTIRAAISYGTLYPTLKRLQTAGWIIESAADQAT